MATMGTGKPMKVNGSLSLTSVDLASVPKTAVDSV